MAPERDLLLVVAGDSKRFDEAVGWRLQRKSETERGAGRYRHGCRPDDSFGFGARERDRLRVCTVDNDEIPLACSR
jgi:hypothetical protein